MMSTIFAAVVFTLLLWWISTTAILSLDRRASTTFAWTMTVATLFLATALVAIVMTRDLSSSLSVYVAFGSGLVVWGWQLMSFYLGYLTGPRKEPCRENASVWLRFTDGIRTSLYHEISSLAFLGLLWILTWNAINQFALWTYLVLYVMHLSAKLNLFFGVRNHGESLLPPDLRFLASYMRHRAINLFFPVSITASTVVSFILFERALQQGVSSFDAAGYAMLGALMALAIVEHWLLILPLPVDAFWQWSARLSSSIATTTTLPPKTMTVDDRLQIRKVYLSAPAPLFARPVQLRLTRPSCDGSENTSSTGRNHVSWISRTVNQPFNFKEQFLRVNDFGATRR